MSSIHFASPVNASKAACARPAVVMTGDPRAVTCDACQQTEDFTSAYEMVEVIESLPESAETEPDAITAARKAVADFSMLKRNGRTIDVQSANAIITVYDAIKKPETRAKFAALPIDTMALRAWAVIEKSRKR